MSAPLRHDESDVAFLISGMDRDCGCPWPQDQLHEEEGLDILLHSAETEGAGADWRDGSYTGLLAMDGRSCSLPTRSAMPSTTGLRLTWSDFTVDMIVPPQDARPDDNTQHPDDVDARSLEVSFDNEDLTTRDQDHDLGITVEVLPRPTSNGHRVEGRGKDI